jgi:SAM-dependent methyltransferase
VTLNDKKTLSLAEGASGATSLRTHCPCCGKAAEHTIYGVPSIPVHSCILLDSVEQASTFRRRDLELAYCGGCGFVFNRVFDETTMAYSTNFEESQHFSGTFNNFARKLAREIAQKCALEGKHILEIGSGKGEFLRELCELANATGTGIDPGYRPDAGRNVGDDRIQFIVDSFGPAYESLTADAILCRHTLEHISNVSEFVAAIRLMCGARKDVVTVFETPDVKRVLQEGAFWDIYYEHCSYFSPGTHARLFRQEGFDVTDLTLAYDDQYIIQYASPVEGIAPARLDLERDLDEMHELAEQFPARVQAVKDHWREKVRSAWGSGRRVVLWGGGSKGVSFLTTLGLEQEVAAAVDINPYKQGKFIPGTGHPVIAPAALVDQAPDMVIVMNPIYVDEVAKSLSTLDLYPEIVALTPL